jgi:NhaA family Na+:H+ antiporter
VHATVAGVVLGLLTPTEPIHDKRSFSALAGGLVNGIQNSVDGADNDSAEAMLGRLGQLVTETEAPSDYLVRMLHPWTAYVILPFFALANAGLTFNFAVLRNALFSPVTLGVFVGLFVGKSLGIAGFAYIATRLRVATLMPHLTWIQVVGLAMLGGVGFTISLFISDLAFSEQSIIDMAKIGVFAASLLSGVLGFLLLRFRKPAVS